MKADADAQGLTTRQAAFVREYLVDLNGTQAALRAGYAESGARTEAARLLAHADVARAIDAAMAAEPGITRTRIVDELAKIAFANMQDFTRVDADGLAALDLSEVTREQFAAVGELTSETYMEGRGDDAVPVKRSKIKLSDKQAALDKLMRVLGGYRDKIALTDPDGGPLVVNIVKGIADKS